MQWGIEEFYQKARCYLKDSPYNRSEVNLGFLY
jgi:hypothetical protein